MKFAAGIFLALSKILQTKGGVRAGLGFFVWAGGAEEGPRAPKNALLTWACSCFWEPGADLSGQGTPETGRNSG